MGQWHPSLSTMERMNYKAEVVRAWHQIHSTLASHSRVETYYVVDLEDLLKKVNSNTTLQISSNIYIMKAQQLCSASTICCKSSIGFTTCKVLVEGTWLKESTMKLQSWQNSFSGHWSTCKSNLKWPKKKECAIKEGRMQRRRWVGKKFFYVKFVHNHKKIMKDRKGVLIFINSLEKETNP